MASSILGKVTGIVLVAPAGALRQPERGVDARGLLRVSLANRYPANEDATMRHAGAANMSRVSFEAGLCQYRINEEISKGVPGMLPAAQSKAKNTSEKAKPETSTPAKKPFWGKSPARWRVSEISIVAARVRAQAVDIWRRNGFTIKMAARAATAQ